MGLKRIRSGALVVVSILAFLASASPANAGRRCGVINNNNFFDEFGNLNGFNGLGQVFLNPSVLGGNLGGINGLGGFNGVGLNGLGGINGLNGLGLNGLGGFDQSGFGRGIGLNGLGGFNGGGLNGLGGFNGGLNGFNNGLGIGNQLGQGLFNSSGAGVLLVDQTGNPVLAASDGAGNLLDTNGNRFSVPRDQFGNPLDRFGNILRVVLDGTGQPLLVGTDRTGNIVRIPQRNGQLIRPILQNAFNGVFGNNGFLNPADLGIGQFGDQLGGGQFGSQIDPFAQGNGSAGPQQRRFRAPSSTTNLDPQVESLRRRGMIPGGSGFSASTHGNDGITTPDDTEVRRPVAE